MNKLNCKEYQEKKLLLLRDLKKLVKYIKNDNMGTNHIQKVHHTLEDKIIRDEYWDYIWD